MASEIARSTSAAPVSNVVELVTAPTWVKAHGTPRIPWSDAPRRRARPPQAPPPQAPRVPRREQMSALDAAITLVLGVIALALIAVTTFLWPIVQHWLARS